MNNVFNGYLPPPPPPQHTGYNGYLPQQNAAYADQVPSTSGMPFQPMQPMNTQMPLQHPRVDAFKQAHMADWMSQHPSCPPTSSYPPHSRPSPAHSVRSHYSTNSITSGMSQLSIHTQLSINTNVTQYSMMSGMQQYWMQQQPLGTENMCPQQWQQPNWTARDVDREVGQIIEILRNDVSLVWAAGSDEQRLHHEKMIKQMFIRLQNLLLLNGTEIPTNCAAPIDCIDDRRMGELLGAMFAALQYNERQFMTPKMKTQWNQQVAKILKYIVYIYKRCRNTVRWDEFEMHVDTLPEKPLSILSSLLTPNKEYTSEAVRIVYFLLRPQNVQRRKRRVRQLAGHALCINGLVSIAIPDVEYMNHLERPLSLDCLSAMLISKDAAKSILGTQLIPELLKRYFRLDGEEPVLHKIPQFLLKISRTKETDTKELFYRQLIQANGYQLIADMLSHGSPRVLLACLDFLISLPKTVMDRIPELERLVIAVLKLIGSTEVNITNSSLKFLFNAVANNASVKNAMTAFNGVQIILSALRLEYSACDATVTYSQVKEFGYEIKRNGMKIICDLIRTSPDTSYVTNPAASQALQQAASFPQLPALICNWMGEQQAEARTTMVTFTRDVLVAKECTSEQRKSILSTQVKLDDQSDTQCVAQAMVSCLFIHYQRFEALMTQNKQPAAIYQLTGRLFEMFFQVAPLPGSEYLVHFLGMKENQIDNLTSLFMRSTSTADVQMLMTLLRFMFFITRTDHPALQQLPARWNQHPGFKEVMYHYSQRQETSGWAMHLLNLAQAGSMTKSEPPATSMAQ